MPRQTRTIVFIFAILVVVSSIFFTIPFLLTKNVKNQAKLSTSFKSPKEYIFSNPYKENPYNCQKDFNCLNKYLKDIVFVYGPKPAMEIFTILQEKELSNENIDDHQIAHNIGRTTAEVFGVNSQAFNLCPTSFNYGCQHGFFEYVLGKTKTPKEAASLICESINSSNPPKSKFYCYHGVGHGVMMAQAYDLKGALDICDSFDNSTAKEGCWQGVFMENVNAGMGQKARDGVFSKTNPLLPCDRVDAKYHHQCYINHAGWLMVLLNNDVSEASKACTKASNSIDISSCLQSIGLMVTNETWQKNLYKGFSDNSNQIAWSLCREFPSSYILECVLGAVDNISNFDELNIKRAKNFCDIISKNYKDDCFMRVGLNIRNLTSDNKSIWSKCEQAKEYSKQCLKGAGIENEAN